MRRMVDGLAGWITFQQAAGASALYGEHFFYPPMQAIALGRKWQVSAQESIIPQNANKSGPPSTIDFIFYRQNKNQWSREGIVIVEVKYLRGDNKTQDIKELRGDIDKLRPLQISQLQYFNTFQNCGAPAKFLIVVGQKSDLEKISNMKARKNIEVVKMLKRGLNNPGKNTYYAIGNTYLSEKYEWQVIAFGETRWPK